MLPSNVAVLPQPIAEFVTLDVETGPAPATAIQEAVAAWKAPANWKPETVEKKRAEQIEKMADRSALLDAAPIIALALHSDRYRLLFNGMSGESFDVPGWLVLGCHGERGLLVALREWLDTCTGPATRLVGHGLVGFDLPRLRGRYAHQRLRLPACLMIRDELQPVFDTMRAIRYFSAENADERFVSLDTVARVLGIEQHKGLMSGADVPKLYEAGRYHEILAYNALDCQVTAQAFRLMTSIATDLE